MKVYDKLSLGRDDAYEKDPAQDDIDTATIWTLHLRVESRKQAGQIIDACEQKRWASSPLFGLLTGEYVEPHDWAEWGERPGKQRSLEDDSKWEEKPMCLSLYFTASTPSWAAHYGQMLAIRLLGAVASESNFVVSTAGDWAEQLDKHGVSIHA
jgi:hypothetical protein